MIVASEPPLLHVLVNKFHGILGIDETSKVLLNQALHRLVPLFTGLLKVLDSTDEVGEAGVPVDIAEKVPRMKVRRADTQRAYQY